jgi:eukaryotic-like serine/threonine-protein kinase
VNLPEKKLEQIEEIYHAALEIAPNEREAFLEKSCGANVELRREVESLLAFDKTSNHYLDAPPASLAAEMLSARTNSADLSGKSIGHYNIKRLLGAGGMGEVYLAEDTKLNRKVALKILPESFAADARRLKRFEREARAVSALNHPNILTVHEFSREGDTHFLATEFVEGETVREKIGLGELSLVDSLNIAEQTAFALSAAHAAGIVHRDIKPENIMIRRDGIVKVLDFGIAKLVAPSGEFINSEGETLARKWTETQPGAMIGTLAYMSPEQVRGKTLDARSDIFSLGVVLYEMLLGKAPFERSTSGDIIAAILTETPPPVTVEVVNAPAELERILNKALKKSCDERYQTSKDFLLDLKSLRRELEFAGASTVRTGAAASGENQTRFTDAANAQTTNSAATKKRGGISSVQWLLIFFAASLAIGGAWWFTGKRKFENKAIQPTAFSQVEVVNWRSTPGEIYSVGSFSPDGKMVAFASTKIGSKNIWVKQLSGGEAVQITKDEFKNQNPIWSPNGDEIAFYSTRGGTSGIWRMNSFGGTPTFIKTVEDGSMVLHRWSKNDLIYYEETGNLFALDIKSGQSSQITNFDAAKVKTGSFDISPGEEQIAYITFENEQYIIWIMPARGGDGLPKQIVSATDEIRNAVWHADGKRVLYSKKTDGSFQIFGADAAIGNPAQITFGERDAFALDVSTDGAKILYGGSKEESDVWGVDVERGEEFSFASDIDSELWATVAPDNETVAYQSVKNLSQGDKICCGAIFTKRNSPGAENFQLVAEGSLPAWSPDGRRLAFVRLAGETFNLWTIGAAGGAEKQLTANGGLPAAEYSVLPYNRTQTSSFDWSPDGKKIAYIAGGNNQSNVWLVNTDDTNRTLLTDNADANLFLYCPLWSTDGRRVAFASKMNEAGGDGKRYFAVSIVDVETKAVKSITRTENFQRLLGFSASGKELFLAEIKGKSPTGLPVETTIIEVGIENGERREIAKLEAAYFYNIRLSADKKMLAYVSNRDGKDNIWLVRSATGGEARKITSNNDNRLYFSTLAWSPDNRAIYFGKQSRYSLLSMITNFK